MSLVNDELLQYYQDNGASSNDLQDAEREFLLIKIPGATGSNQDLWYTFLTSLGYRGANQDMRDEFFRSPISPPVPFVIAKITPLDFVATCTIEVYGNDFTIDWGDGNLIEYAGGNPVSVSVIPTGDIFIADVNGVNQLKFISDTYQSIDIIDGKNLTSMFELCKNLSSLISFDAALTANVTDFSAAWWGCSGLTLFPIIDTSNGLTFSNTWRDCSGLTSFPSLDFGSAVSLTRTFRSCVLLTSFPIINVSNVAIFLGTWFDCNKIISFPDLDFSNGTDFTATFSSCLNLQFTGILNTEKGQLFTDMFRDCTSLFCIVDINTLLQTNTINMFLNTPTLVAPNSTEQTAILAGDNWINVAPCP